MAVKIRLRRMGAKKKPFFRIVVADARSPREGRFIETIGHYDPKGDPPVYTVDQERAKHWLSHGAQPTEAVARVLFRVGLIEQPWTDEPPTEAPSAEQKQATPAATRQRAPKAEEQPSQPTGAAAMEEPAAAEAPAAAEGVSAAEEGEAPETAEAAASAEEETKE